MRAGITGHQDLGTSGNIAWVEERLAEWIARESVNLGFTSLARGADQLFAKILRRKEIPFVGILPSVGYETTFEVNADRERFVNLCAAAVRLVRLDFSAPTEAAFLAAGRRVVDEAEMVFAIWNGLPAAGTGGTGDVVAYALAQGKRLVHLDPWTRKILEIEK
ncbi:MAG TPA: hypothetical protein VFE33_33305 [Thermoanaerobaculia bacterium]|nr:hypothetical protein [Thermoanaerobaculia bacterium]